MIHFTCDRCGKEMTSSEEGRYVVKMEVLPGFDPDLIREEDLDDDPMEAVSQLIQSEAEFAAEELAEPRRQSLHFDLCSSCRHKFLSDPLGRETPHQVHFSEN